MSANPTAESGTQRRLIAAGRIHRHQGREHRLTITAAGVTGSIRTTGTRT